MKSTLEFFKKIGKLKNIQRKGILFYGVKEADSTADHVFRFAVMAWILGQNRKLDLAKVLKLVLVHDLCKVYTGDITPYDGLFPKSKTKKDQYKFAWRWRRLSLKEKQKRYGEKVSKEQKALHRLIAKLPKYVQNDMMRVWMDYQRVESPEAQFVVQIGRIENLIESLENFEKNRKFPTLPWWEDADEVVHDKELLELMEEISKAEIRLKK